MLCFFYAIVTLCEYINLHCSRKSDLRVELDQIDKYRLNCDEMNGV